MMTVTQMLRLCLWLVPAESRVVRQEQWEADLLYGSEVGVSRAEVVVGALVTGLRLRALSTFKLTRRGIASLQRGKVMKAKS